MNVPIPRKTEGRGGMDQMSWLVQILFYMLLLKEWEIYLTVVKLTV